MTDPYRNCPSFENDNYLLRLVEAHDAADLLHVYSDDKAVPLFNGDNCHGDDFHYTTLERMQSAVDFWVQSYHEKWFVRWTIVDCRTQQAIGTIELFNRQAQDYFNDCGLLRLDLRSDYEQAQHLYDILTLIVPPAYTMFNCKMIAIKVPPFASERRKAVQKLGFVLSQEALIGSNDGISYTDYYVLFCAITPTKLCGS